MSENKPNKVLKPLRILKAEKDFIVQRAVDLDIFEYEVVTLMTECYRRFGSQIQPGTNQGEATNTSEQESTTGTVDPKFISQTANSTVLLQTGNGETEVLTPEEWRWVRRGLYVLRGKVKQAVEPLDTNMDAFCLLTDLVTGGSAIGERSSVSTGETDRDLSGAMEELQQSQADAERGKEDAAATQQRVSEATRELGEARRPVRKGRGRHKSNASGRRGN